MSIDKIILLISSILIAGIIIFNGLYDYMTSPSVIKRRKFFKELRQIQHKYIPEGSRGLYKNADWRKEWSPVIKYDQDWDWEFLFNLILYKIEKMRLTLNNSESSSDERKERINEEITTVLALGEKLKNHDYHEEASQFSAQHVTNYILIYEQKGDSHNWIYGKEIDRIALPPVEIDEALFFPNRSDVILKWCEEHGKTEKDICVGTMGEWDSDDNKLIYDGMMQTATKNEQFDYDKFFGLIASYMRGCWD